MFMYKLVSVTYVFLFLTYNFFFSALQEKNPSYIKKVKVKIVWPVAFFMLFKKYLFFIPLHDSM